MGADSAALAASMSDLEAEVRSLSFAMRKMDNTMKHQEQQQQQRDQAQDELQRMEFAKMNRDIEVCIKEKELEAFRSRLEARMSHLEAEAKEDAERAGKALKENLSEKIMDVASSVERIAASTEQQVRNLDEKLKSNDADDHERETTTNQTFADLRNKCSQLSYQISYLVDHVGADPNVMTEGDAAIGGDWKDPSTPKLLQTSSAKKMPSGGGGVLQERVESCERRLDALDGGAGDAATRPSPPGSRPLSRQLPLPERIDRLEYKHEDLVDTLEETLGIKLESERPDSPPGSSRLDSPPDSSRRRKKDEIGPDRLSVIESQIGQLAAAMGVDLNPPAVNQAADGDRPGTAQNGTAARIDLLNAMLDEVASALGLTPEELEKFARAESRGNLAGRVVLRDEAAAVSPRMAGMIAGQEDRIGQLDSRMSEMFRDFDDKILNRLDKHDLRLRNLEDHASPGSKGTNLDNLQKQSLVNEDLSDASSKHPEPKAKAKAGPPSGAVSGGATEGGTGASTNAPTSRENEEMMGIIMDEVRLLTEEAEDIKSRLRHLDGALEALRAGSPAPVVQEALGAPSPRKEAAMKAAVEAAKTSEESAQAAAASAEACLRLKEELAEIVNAVNVPSFPMEDSLFDDAKPVEGEDLDIDDEVRDDAARQYVERQSMMEARLKQLEEHIDSASVVSPESQIFSSLKSVIKDVRRCLSRCELLYQLPEIKAFVKRFQRSLEVNAILHEKWLGPAAPKRQHEELSLEQRPVTAPGEEFMTRDSDMTRSAPDLRARGGRQGPTGKKSESVKKKPFRTVVDWVRPHTPLKIDPLFKGHSPPSGERRVLTADDRPTPHLPQIK